MKIIALILFFFMSCLMARSQDTTMQRKALEKEKYWQNWMRELYEVGIDQHGDTLKISDEVRKIVVDTAYQKKVYPAVYTIKAAGALMKEMEVKKAMWYLINVYAQHKEARELVLKIILPFEQGLEMDKVLISAFYTYAMVDPGVGSLKKGKIEISRPDVLEQKFNVLKEIIAHIVSKRKVENKNAEKAIGKTKSDNLKALGSGGVKNEIKVNK